MSSDIRLAFAHPSERAAASPLSDGPLRDRISLRDYITEVEIGAFQAERGTMQRIKFNVVVELAPVTGPIDDDVDRILSYDKVTEAIQFELSEERLNLLETLAERVAERILLEPQAERVFVRVEKLDRGPGALGVEIARERVGGIDSAMPMIPDNPEEVPHPRVVYLSNAAIASDALTALIDDYASRDEPLIFCVGPDDIPAPRSHASLAQRRIDLLAIEQNAWVLAGRDRRCVVVDTRTELDWAMKNAQICVWAPSKMVLDAVDGPSGDPKDAPALAAWFAEELQAMELCIVDDQIPETRTPTSLRALNQA